MPTTGHPRPSLQVRPGTTGVRVWTQLLDARGFDRISSLRGWDRGIDFELGYSVARATDPARVHGPGFALGLITRPCTATDPRRPSVGLVDLDAVDLDALAAGLTTMRSHARRGPGAVCVRAGSATAWQPWPTAGRASAVQAELRAGMGRVTPLHDLVAATGLEMIRDGWRANRLICGSGAARALLAEFDQTAADLPSPDPQHPWLGAADDFAVTGAFAVTVSPRGVGSVPATADDEIVIAVTRGARTTREWGRIVLYAVNGHPGRSWARADAQAGYAALREAGLPGPEAARALAHVGL